MILFSDLLLKVDGWKKRKQNMRHRREMLVVFLREMVDVDAEPQDAQKPT